MLPADDAEKVTVRRSDEFNVLSIEEVHAVARAAASDLLGAIVLVARFTGLRQGELLALRWRDVDFANRIVHVRRNLPAGTEQEETPKSHRVRSVPMSDQALIALDGLSRREHFTDPGDLVFGSVVGEHLSVERVVEAVAHDVVAAGFGHLRAKQHPIVFHDLRHTFGTTCAAKGIDLPSQPAAAGRLAGRRRRVPSSPAQWPPVGAVAQRRETYAWCPIADAVVLVDRGV